MTGARVVGAADVARVAPPVILGLVAAGVPSLAGPAAAVLVAGAVVAIGRRVPVAWAWAAMVPAALLAMVRAFSGVMPFGSTSCAAFASPAFAWAVGEAAVVVVAFTLLAVGLRTRRSSIALRGGARSTLRLAAGGFVAAVIGGLIVVSVARGAIPGPVGEEPPLGAFVAAVVLGALAVAVAEEVAFRGVMQHWLSRTIDEVPAIAVQAAVYGVWVAAIGWGPLLGAVAVAAGLVAGVLAMRTNSLLVPIAWHWGIAIPLLAAMLCPH